ncbi:MAG: ATP-binding protein [Campylobacterales bacterium]|nr:ATP-binding protein [Campylobacterales bacterium]
MKFLIDFLDNDAIEKTHVFTHLKCSKEEALALRHMTSQYLAGTIDLSVSEVLMELFGTKAYNHLNHLPVMKSLMDSGWVIQSSFAGLKMGEVSNLELFNSSVCLSTTFLKLLEEGTLEMILPETTPYADHLEYLKDQFFRIELYQKLGATRQNGPEFSHGFNRLQTTLVMLEAKIAERIKATKNEIIIEALFEEHLLEEKEQIIFLALLKEEYAGEFESLREMNTLISLVSYDDYEKIKNRALLEEGSKLVESGLIDYDEMLTAFGGVARSFYIQEDILQKIMHPDKEKKNKKIKLDMLVEQQEIFELIDPKTSLDDVVMHPKTRELMNTLLKQVDRTVVARLKEWGIKKNRRGIDAKVLLYGPPGTGKTMTAVSLAKSLKKRVLSFDCSKILSKYVGESEQNVRKIFDTYKEMCIKTKSEPVLLLNEADQFLSARSADGGSGADKMHNQMQNIFLEQIERFEGILIATTNFLESLDVAFSRRFDYKIAFEKPDFKQRLDLWRRVLPESAVYEADFNIEILANYPLSGGQIVVVLKNTALKVAIKEEPIFTMEDFIQAITRETSGAFGEGKTMGFAQ